MDVSPAVPDWFRGDHRRVWRERALAIAFSRGCNDITFDFNRPRSEHHSLERMSCNFATQNFNEMVRGELKGIFYFHHYIIFGILRD